MATEPPSVTPAGYPASDAGDGRPHAAPAIVARGLTKSFGARKALDSLSFELPRGGFLSVFGPNGAGKSTLLRLLATLARPSAGEAEVLGLDIRQEADAVRSAVGLISHRSMLFPDLTAEANLLLYARLYGVAEPRRRVDELLELVELGSRRHDQVRGLSRGMGQRLSIARALVHSPRLLLMDEPYSGLDPRAMAVFDGLLERLSQEMSLVLVSHDLERGFGLATHLMVLAQGRLAAFAEAAELGAEGFLGLYRQVAGEAGR